MTSVAYCKEAKELLDAFAQVVRELIELHKDQFDALVAGDTDSQRFEDLIHMANERKHQAKYAYLYHLEAHGCSLTHGIDQE
jgi:hypothetical protein